MKQVNCLVVDDEELARILLENYISRMPHLNLVEKCSNPLEALKVLQDKAIDILFLDIQMPELTGIDFIKSLQKKPKIIFTTAYSEYAIEGYQLDVVDYLLKPFGFERFVQAANKAVELLNPQTSSSEKDSGAWMVAKGRSENEQDNGECRRSDPNHQGLRSGRFPLLCHSRTGYRTGRQLDRCRL